MKRRIGWDLEGSQTQELLSLWNWGLLSSGHVWMWELNCEEGWVPKNWCFWTVVLEKTLGSPLDCKEIQLVHPKGNQSWVFGRTDAEAETPILWPPHAELTHWKRPWCWEGLGQEKWTTEDEMAGWHHWLDGRESEWTLGVGDGQGGLACCNSWGHKESDMTEWLNWTDMIKTNFIEYLEVIFIISKFCLTHWLQKIASV